VRSDPDPKMSETYRRLVCVCTVLKTYSNVVGESRFWAR